MQGPWSDLYALGGTLYRAVTGRPPDEATLRVGDDRMQSAIAAAKNGQYRRRFLGGIDACLKVRHSERPRSVAQLRPMLTMDGVSEPRLERLLQFSKQTRRLVQPQRIVEVSRRTRLHLDRIVQTSVRAGESLSLVRLTQLLEQARQSPQLDRLQEARRWASLQLERFAAACMRASRQLGRVVKTASARAIASLRFERPAQFSKQAMRALPLERIRAAGATSVQWAGRGQWIAIAIVAAVIGGTYGIYVFTHQLLNEGNAHSDVEVQRRVDDDKAARALADAEARRLAETEAKHQQDARAADEKTRQESEARRQANAAAATEAAQRIATVSLGADERAAFVKRVQELLKSRHCYEGTINGSSDDAQTGLDRFVESAHKRNLEKPLRIELAKADASDFDTWLRDADSVKGEMCAVAKPKSPERPRRAPTNPSYRGSGGGGGTIQGVR